VASVDRAVGVALAVLGGAVAWSARAFPAVPGQKVGAGFLPTLVGLGLLVCGVLLVLRRPPAGEASAGGNENGALARHRFVPALVVLGSLLAYVLLADKLGYLLVAPVMVFACCRAFGTHWRAALLWAVLGSLVVHVAFYKLLRVPLPWGALRPFY